MYSSEKAEAQTPRQADEIREFACSLFGLLDCYVEFSHGIADGELVVVVVVHLAESVDFSKVATHRPHGIHT